jgi:hypothetical protein
MTQAVYCAISLNTIIKKTSGKKTETAAMAVHPVNLNVGEVLL